MGECFRIVTQFCIVSQGKFKLLKFQMDMKKYTKKYDRKLFIYSMYKNKTYNIV